MKNYIFYFTGREINAIGIFYPITARIAAENIAAAKYWLYTKYEHCTGVVVTEDGAEIPNYYDVIPAAGTTAKPIIKLLIVTALEWFDRAAANSYFSAHICINSESIYLPFQYGYERAYIQQTYFALQKLGFEVGEGYNIEKYCNENRIVSQFTKRENCLKREVIRVGKGL